jgi:tRNA(His) 5'-end guanylyltransferase
MKEELGDRMKNYYENRTRYFLPIRTYTLIRLDGVHFHTYTRGLNRPFDEKLMNDMDETAKFVCSNIQGAKFAFIQSDEISLLVTDFENIKTSAWFEGNIQKISSVSSAMATAKFNELRPGKLAFFDSRVFTITTKVEVENYFVWRQQDTVRNSISSVAQYLYSHKELNGKNSKEKQELIFQKGINWNDYSAKYKRGRMIVKEYYMKEETKRSKWSIVEPPIFTKNIEYIRYLIPDLI